MIRIIRPRKRKSVSLSGGLFGFFGISANSLPKIYGGPWPGRTLSSSGDFGYIQSGSPWPGKTLTTVPNTQWYINNVGTGISTDSFEVPFWVDELDVIRRGSSPNLTVPADWVAQEWAPLITANAAFDGATRSAMGADLTGSNKWRGCVLAPNGKIYCAPLSATDVLIIGSTGIVTPPNLQAILHGHFNKF